MTILSLDYETRSAVDLKKAGTHRYAADSSTDIWCAAYAFDDEPVEVWVPGESCPDRVWWHIFEGGTLSAWNAGFERIITERIAGPRYGWPVPRLEQWEDTAAWGAAMGLPRGLGDAAKAMGLPQEKDDEGHRLMLRMSKPRRARKGEAAEGLLWWDDAERVERLLAYCRQDVEAERALRRVLFPLQPQERETWLFDQRMNDRGVRIDVDLVNALHRIADKAALSLDAEMADATGGWVTACTQVGRLTEWLRDVQGVPATSLAKAALEEMLVSDLPPDARRAVEIRQLAAKTSTKKLDAMLACVDDGRARGQHLYYGASTGRWAGRLIQVQNMPRGTGTVTDPDAAVADFMDGRPELIQFQYGAPMNAISDMLRACFVASPGCRLLVADFSAIEGRVTAWLAGEDWKIEAFEEADRGGSGIYELTAASILSKPVEAITKAERQAYGKVPELALGFQGGVMAFNSMAAIYRVNMADAYEPLLASTDTKTWERAEKRYAECLERQDTGTDVMTREAWIASEVTKVLWRAKHPATQALWRGLEEAAFDAVLHPGTTFSFRGIDYVVGRGFLWCKLPSGHVLAYGGPKISERETPWGERKSVVTVLGVDSVTRRWARYALYGGLCAENCLAGGTEVLTDAGWRRLDMVRRDHRVWDGAEWVRHDGLLRQGHRETIDFGGVRMTPDHKVWTAAGWRRAEETSYEEAASQGTEPDRPSVRPTDGDGLRRVERGEVAVASALRLRDGEDLGRRRAAKGQHAKLRLPAGGTTPRPGHDARNVGALGLCSVAQHDRPLHPADAPGVAQLRGPRYRRLRTVARLLRRILAGHGADLRSRADDRAPRQLEGLRAGQLRVGNAPAPVSEQEGQPHDRHARGTDASLRGFGTIGHRQDDASLSVEARLAGGANVRHARQHEPVFDLLNAGPRHRFTVRGADGRPFIVSNCIQAIARDLIRDGMLAADAAGYPIVLTVHDEAVADVPDGFGSLAEFERLLCSKGPWADGLPVVAEGYEAQRYRK